MRWTWVAFVVGMHVCMLLEVMDFPPLFGLVETHALWHATTPPFVFVWYRRRRLASSETPTRQAPARLNEAVLNRALIIIIERLRRRERGETWKH